MVLPAREGVRPEVPGLKGHPNATLPQLHETPGTHTVAFSHEVCGSLIYAHGWSSAAPEPCCRDLFQRQVIRIPLDRMDFEMEVRSASADTLARLGPTPPY